MEEMQVLKREEEDLAADLRKVCSPYGDEIESKLNETSEILFSMGRLYVKKAEITTGMEQKLNFIRAAALLHGARVRFEKNLRDKVKVKDVCDTLDQMESNLLMSCRGILPGAQTLVKISRNFEKGLKFLRHIEESDLEKLEIISENIPEADARMKQEKKIRQVQYLMQKNTNNFTCMMSHVAQKCLDILKKPPCRFAIVGLGSLARREITLYSDFEHVIVLEEGMQDSPEYESIKEYFRWFAVLFEIIIIGLGETIIPSVGVKSLNDLYAGDKTKKWFYDTITPSGVSIDGMMPHACKTPLGRQELTEKKKHIVELILPVSKMSSLLSTDADLKNGYNLKDVLRQSCFVFGCAALFRYFRRQSLNVLFFEDDKDGLDSLPKITIDKVFDPVTGLLLTFGPHEVESKLFYYRPLSVFLSYVGRITKCFDPSSFQIIQECICTKFQHEMLWAFAVASELRMRIYAHGCGNRQRVSDRHLSQFIGGSCLRNCVRQLYTLAVVGQNQSETLLSDQDFRTRQEAHALMASGFYKEARDILMERIEQLSAVKKNADQWLNEHKFLLNFFCLRAAVSSQRQEKTKLYEEAEKLMKSLEGTEFEDKCWKGRFQIYVEEGRYHAAFDTVEKLFKRDGDSIFTKFDISCIHFGKVIALKFSSPSSAVAFCDKALEKYTGFHSQVAFKHGKALAVTQPGMEHPDQNEFRDLAKYGKNWFRDLEVDVQNGIRYMSKLDVMMFYDDVLYTQLFYKWWEDALVLMESREIIQKSKHQDNNSQKIIDPFCAGPATKYLLKSMLEKDFKAKYELFRKSFQSFRGSANLFAFKRSFYYYLNVRALYPLRLFDVETSLLLKYSRELNPEGLDNFEKRSNVMCQLLPLLFFYRMKMQNFTILDVADNLIDVLDKFCSFLHHPLFANALYGIRTACGMETRNLVCLVGGRDIRICRLKDIGSKLSQIMEKAKLKLDLAGESRSRKKYRKALEMWFLSDFKRCIHSFWRIIISKNEDFAVRTRSVAMFFHSVVALNGMEYIYNHTDSEYVLRELPVPWPFIMQYPKTC